MDPDLTERAAANAANTAQLQGQAQGNTREAESSPDQGVICIHVPPASPMREMLSTPLLALTNGSQEPNTVEEQPEHFPIREASDPAECMPPEIT